MCRMLVDNGLLTRENVLEIIPFLNDDNGGDGAGFVWTEENEKEQLNLRAWKSHTWQDNHVDWMAEMFLDIRNVTNNPVMWHTRKASVGGISSYYTHPIITGEVTLEESPWTRSNGSVYADNIRSLIMHNGTMDATKLVLLKTVFKMVHPEIDTYALKTMSDTQFMAQMVAAYNEFDIIGLMGEVGNVIFAGVEDNELEIVFHKGTSRPLFCVAESLEKWLVVSALKYPMVLEFQDRGYKIAPVPYSTHSAIEVVRRTLDNPLTDKEVDTEFAPKKSYGGNISHFPGVTTWVNGKKVETPAPIVKKGEY